MLGAMFPHHLLETVAGKQLQHLVENGRYSFCRGRSYSHLFTHKSRQSFGAAPQTPNLDKRGTNHKIERDYFMLRPLKRQGHGASKLQHDPQSIHMLVQALRGEDATGSSQALSKSGGYQSSALGHLAGLIYV